MKKIKFTWILLAIGFIPCMIACMIMAIFTINNSSKSLEEGVYEKLFVAADGLRQYYAYDIYNAESYDDPSEVISYEHDYVDMLKNKDIEMTLFIGDIRYITSALNDKGERNEGTQMGAEIWAEVSKGNDYKGDKVVIGGKEYYVYYVPLKDKGGKVIGSAWAGTPEEDVKRSIAKSVISTLIIMALSLIFFGITIFIISRKIVNILNKVVEETNLIAKGDLSSHENISSFIFEIDLIGNSLMSLRETLSNIISKMISDADNLSENVESQLKEADTCNTHSGDILRAADELSRGSMEMAESVQNSNENMINMSENIDNIGELAKSTEDKINNVGKESDKSTNALNGLIKANKDTLNATENICEGIEESSKAIKEIQKFTEAIEAIATQTNLLSLNASIEAARAGEAGRGFAVVADEIRTLADQSNQSSQEISNIITRIVDISDKNVSNASQISKAVEDEKEVLETVKESFDTVSLLIGDSVKDVGNINESIKSMISAKDKILDDITSLSSISEENAASCEETNASMENMNTLISDIKDKAEKTSVIAEEMKKTTKYFNI